VASLRSLSDERKCHANAFNPSRRIAEPRGLNGWVSGDLSDAKKWRNLGAQKFSDSDFVYVYQLFYATDHSTKIDKYLPAKTLFASTLNFVSSTPPPSYKEAGPLIAALRQ
jgi:hypothetical protein